MVDDQATRDFRRVLQGLLDKSKADEVVWQEELGTRGIPGYVVKFPASAIRIEFHNPSSEPDSYVAILVNDKGRGVKTLEAYETDPFEWNLLANLWQEGYRCTTGWDKALADADAAIKTQNVVGDDDIPF